MEPSFEKIITRNPLTRRNYCEDPYKIPFSAFLVISLEKNQIEYFSQTLANLFKLHPSTQNFSLPDVRSGELFVSSNIEGNSHKIIQFFPDKAFTTSVWMERCIHELRTSSLILNLGKRIPFRNSALEDKIFNALKRQELATIVASDLLQLLGTTQKIQLTSLSSILREASFYIGDRSHTTINILNKLEMNHGQLNDPVIWGNSHFLTNFFRTLLYWCSQPIKIEVEMFNPFSVSVSFFLNDSEDLSQRTGYQLIYEYLVYVSAFFNFRSWILPNRIHIILPLFFDYDNF